MTEPKVLWAERYKYLKAIQGLPLQDKIERTNSFIDKILEISKRPVLAWSGGKDSTVALYLLLKKKPNIDVVWINTGVEFPECIRFVQKIKREWSLNLHIAKPSLTFWTISEKYGWPMMGKGGSGYWWSRAQYLKQQGKTKLAKATQAARISAACCRILKEKPMKDACLVLGADLVIVGNLVSESRQRFLTWAQKGDFYFAKSEKRWKAWILAPWTDSDIRNFNRIYNVPSSSIYEMGHLRNGCWPCLMDIKFKDNKLSILRRSHPDLWRFLILKKGLGKRLLALKLALSDDEVNDFQNRSSVVEQLIEDKPCFFDTI